MKRIYELDPKTSAQITDQWELEVDITGEIESDKIKISELMNFATVADPTRINDLADTTFIDTDLVADTIVMQGNQTGSNTIVSIKNGLNTEVSKIDGNGALYTNDILALSGDRIDSTSKIVTTDYMTANEFRPGSGDSIGLTANTPIGGTRDGISLASIYGRFSFTTNVNNLVYHQMKVWANTSGFEYYDITNNHPLFGAATRVAILRSGETYKGTLSSDSVGIGNASKADLPDTMLSIYGTTTGTGTNLIKVRDSIDVEVFKVDDLGYVTQTRANFGTSDFATIEKTTDGNSKPIVYNSINTSSFKSGHIFKIDGIPKLHIPKNGNVIIESGLTSNTAFSNRASSSLYVKDNGNGGISIYNQGTATLDFGTRIESNNVRQSARIKAVQVDSTYRTNLVIATSNNLLNNIIDFAYFTHNQRFGLDTSTPTEKLDVVGSVKISEVLKLTGLTSTAIGLLTPTAGDITFNTTTNKHQGYDGTTWNNLY